MWVNLNDDQFRSFGSGSHRMLRVATGAMLAGPTDQGDVIEIESGRSHVCVDFELGAAGAFFQSGPGSVRNEWVGLEELWGPAVSVRERVLAAPTPTAKLDVIERVLTEQLVDGAEVDIGMQHAAAGLSRGNHVGAVADALGLLPKTLRRRFVRAVGLTPKRFARVERLRRLTATIESSSVVDWAQLAVEHGYCDQAHLVDDFRDLIGVTPTYYAANRVDGPNHIAPPQHLSPPDAGDRATVAG